MRNQQVSKGKGNVEHNNREEKIERDNIDKERSKNNITLVNIPIKDFYEQTFDKQLKITMRNKREKIEK